MNLARILEQSTEEVRPVQLREHPPRLHPKLVVREHRERDTKMYLMLIPGGRPPHYFRMNEMQWSVCRLFDGQRTPEQVVHAAARLGIRVTLDDVNHFIEILDRDEFFYRTPEEQSVALCQELMKDRQAKLKKQADVGDLSTIILTAFNPDRFLTWVYRHFKWLYSRWFTVWSVFMVIVMFVLLGSHWKEVWADSIEYYRLTGHGFGHFLNFLGAFLVLSFFHETAHGLTCKHLGGEVHRMGAVLIYLVPCVYCDVSQAWVYGDRWDRITTVFAGVWSEIVLCSYAAVVWWLTPPGTFLHNAAYLVILAGGIFCVMINWNPLSRMDGYMMMTEYFRIHDIKTVATKWWLAWLRKNVFHMPATVPPISRQRAIAFAFYAMAAGAYSYFLLLFFVRVLYHILYYYTPQWAFLPAGLLALRIFRSRILKLGTFMKELYLDKKELLRPYAKAIAAGAAALLVLGLVPLRREKVVEPFMFEPAQRAVLRAQVPGRVLAVDGDEGRRVGAGAVIARLSNLVVASEKAAAAAEYRQAEARAFDAQLHYADYAGAQEKWRDAQTQYRLASGKDQQLTVTSPISGVVLTPRVRDLLGSYIDAGTVIAEVGDLSTVRARIYVPEHELRRVQNIHDVVLRPESRWTGVAGTVLSISPASQQPAAGLIPESGYKGIKLPEYFVVTVAVANPAGEFRDGMTGTAIVSGRRRSAWSLLLEPAVNAIARRFW